MCIYLYEYVYIYIYEYIGGLLMVDGVINLIFHHSICSRMSEMADYCCHGVLTASFSLVSTWLAGKSPPIGSLNGKVSHVFGGFSGKP